MLNIFEKFITYRILLKNILQITLSPKIRVLLKHLRYLLTNKHMFSFCKLLGNSVISVLY